MSVCVVEDSDSQSRVIGSLPSSDCLKKVPEFLELKLTKEEETWKNGREKPGKLAVKEERGNGTDDPAFPQLDFLHGETRLLPGGGQETAISVRMKTKD